MFKRTAILGGADTVQSGLENALASSQKEELWKMFQDAAEKELTGARNTC